VVLLRGLEPDSHPRMESSSVVWGRPSPPALASRVGCPRSRGWNSLEVASTVRCLPEAVVRREQLVNQVPFGPVLDLVETAPVAASTMSHDCVPQLSDPVTSHVPLSPRLLFKPLFETNPRRSHYSVQYCSWLQSDSPGQRIS
jgi:hypothetical protein